MTNTFFKFENLSEEDTRDLRDACVNFDAKNILGPEYEDVISDSIPRLKLYWRNKAEFEIYIKSITGTRSVVEANKKLEKRLSDFSSSKKEAVLEPDMPDKWAREAQKAEMIKREEEIRSTIEQAKKEVNDSIQRQQKLAGSVAAKKLYTKTEVPDRNALSEKQKGDIDVLKEAAKSDPQQLIDQIAQTIESRMDTPPDGATNDEVKLVARKAAYETVDALLGQSPAEEIAILKSVGTNNDYIKNTVQDPELRSLLTNTARDVAQEKLIQYSINRDVVATTFGENFANSIFGPQNPELIKVNYSFTPQKGFSEYKIDSIPRESIFSSSSGADFLNNIRGYTEGEIKNSTTRFAASKLESLIGRLPKNNFLVKTYNNQLVQGVLSRFGLGSTSVAWEGTTFFGRLAAQNGFAPILNWIGAKTGINFGISKVVGAVGKQLGQKIALGVATKAAGQAAGAAITTATTTAGSLGGPLGALAGLVLGWITDKIIQRIPWKKIAPWLLGALAGIGVFMFGGVWAGILTGVLVAGALSLAAGGATLGLMGVGVIKIIGTITGIFVIVFGPGLIAIVIAPIIVALILFVINSGAYIVPPTTSSLFANISCTQEKQLSGVSYSTSSPIASRALNIVDDLYQGFWCYWNRSPKAPVEYFPNDVLLHPPGYPELFDYKLFLTNPNIPEGAGPNLFWCTYLVIKSYSENQTSVPYELNTQNMFNAWSKDKVVSADKATPSNIVPGSVVFFHVTTGPNRLNHVGIVYSVDSGGIVMVQSNAPLKTQTLNFKSGSTGVGNLPLMEVKYFGLP